MDHPAGASELAANETSLHKQETERLGDCIGHGHRGLQPRGRGPCLQCPVLLRFHLQPGQGAFPAGLVRHVGPCIMEFRCVAGRPGCKEGSSFGARARYSSGVRAAPWHRQCMSAPRHIHATTIFRGESWGENVVCCSCAGLLGR